MMKTKWTKLSGDGLITSSNSILEGDGFYISYNPDPGTSKMAQLFGFGSDTGGPETALIKDGEFFILNGDFRASYEKLAPNWEACKQFYDQQSAHAESSWSTNWSERKQH